jgi:hypothetical protein
MLQSGFSLRYKFHPEGSVLMYSESVLLIWGEVSSFTPIRNLLSYSGHFHLIIVAV